MHNYLCRALMYHSVYVYKKIIVSLFNEINWRKKNSYLFPDILGLGVKIEGYQTFK